MSWPCLCVCVRVCIFFSCSDINFLLCYITTHLFILLLFVCICKFEVNGYFHFLNQASVTKATKICPARVEVRRTAKSLDSEISRIKVKISTQQEQQGDREEIVRYIAWIHASVFDNILTAFAWKLCYVHVFHFTCVSPGLPLYQTITVHLNFFICLFLASRQYHEAMENYKNMSQQMKNLNSFIKSLDSVMNHRLQVYADLRRQVENCCY